MRFKYEVLYRSLVIEQLLKEKLITKDHYDHMWEVFADRGNELTYTLIDLADVLINLDQVDCEMIVNYMTANHNLKEFYTTKIAI